MVAINPTHPRKYYLALAALSAACTLGGTSLSNFYQPLVPDHATSNFVEGLVAIAYPASGLWVALDYSRLFKGTKCTQINKNKGGILRRTAFVEAFPFIDANFPDDLRLSLIGVLTWLAVQYYIPAFVITFVADAVSSHMPGNEIATGYFSLFFAVATSMELVFPATEGLWSPFRSRRLPACNLSPLTYVWALALEQECVKFIREKLPDGIVPLMSTSADAASFFDCANSIFACLIYFPFWITAGVFFTLFLLFNLGTLWGQFGWLSLAAAMFALSARTLFVAFQSNLVPVLVGIGSKLLRTLWK